MIVARATLAAVALAAAGCGEGSRLPAGSAVGELRLEESHTVGFAEAGPAAFGSIGDVELGADGSLYVLDRLNRVVQVFDGSGGHVRTLGGRGGGPGELERPDALFWGPDGGLWVVDAGNQRFTVYDPAGGLAATYRRPVAGFGWEGGASPTGAVYDVARPFALESSEPGELVEQRLEGGELREVSRTALPATDPTPLYRFEGGGMVQVLPIPYGPAALSRVGPDGHLWYGHTGAPWVYRRSLADGSELTFGRELDAIAVTDADRAAVLERREVEELRSLGGATAVAAFMDLIPDARPAYEDFFFDDVGGLWIMRPIEGDGYQVDVYDSTAVLVASGPVRFEPDPRPRVRGDRVAAVVRDGMDVPGVVVYRIQRRDSR